VLTVGPISWIKTPFGDMWFTEYEGDNLKIKYKIKEIVFSEHSSIQHIMVLDSFDYGRMLILDGILQTTSKDGHIYNEMITHVPLSFHPDPKNVLIIGGGDCGAAREVVKYKSVKRIDMVEIDDLVVNVSRKYLPQVSGNISDPRLNFVFQDGTSFVSQQKDRKYDVVIVDSSDPVGPAVSLFEKEFYQNIFKMLKDDGLMVCQSESPIFYMNILSDTYNRVSSLFPITKLYTAIVPTYPGGLWSFTLGSKKYEKPYINEFNKDTLYVNKEIIEGCFSIPEGLKSKLFKG
jgi:spermidine synthase